MSISIQVSFDEKMVADLLRIPEVLRLGPADRCLSAMCKPIVAKAKALAPSSRRSGSRRKWSQKIKNDPKWSGIDSGKHIGMKVAKHNKGARVFVGAQYPKGNKQQFDASPNGRRVKLWGRDAGRVRLRDNPHFLQKAYDETKGAQIAAFEKQFAIEIKELKLG